MDSSLPTGTKRKFQENSDTLENERPFSSRTDDEAPSSSGAEDKGHSSPRITGSFAGLRLPGLTVPKSQYTGWESPFEPVPEQPALEELFGESLDAARKRQLNDNVEYTIIHLSDFKVYYETRDGQKLLRPLNELWNRRGHNLFRFDGVLELDGRKMYVENVPFETLSLDGYGTDETSIFRNTCIQSQLAKPRDIWYLLKEPSLEYKRFFDPFCWLCDFAKHLVAFLDDHDDVCLEDFRSKFYIWLHSRHSYNAEFHNWFHEYRCNKDFRSVLTANYEFLEKEATSVQSDHFLCSLWKDIIPEEPCAVFRQVIQEKKTVVSPYVYECFKDTYFAPRLKVKSPCDMVASARESRIAAHNSRLQGEIRVKTSISLRISSGDVVSIPKDDVTKWRGDSTLWYAYVQEVKRNKEGRYYLNVIWLYKAEDTWLRKANYPHHDELFFSNHCNCNDDSKPIFFNDVKARVAVSFFASQRRGKDSFFIQQKYMNNETPGRWVTLNEDHLACPCRNTKSKAVEEYKKDDFILMQPSKTEQDPDPFLEPVQVVSIQTDNTVFVRCLPRRRRDCGDQEARPNELVYSNKIIKIHKNQLKRKVQIRCLPVEDVRAGKIQAPYCYGGISDFWIVTGGSTSYKEPSRSPRPLRALSSFSGGGMFDRGLEEGGAVEVKWCIEWDIKAILTNKANTKHGTTAIFFGSINDSNARLLAGDECTFIPRIGEVDVIIAGSPCVAFSRMQQDRYSDKSLDNASKVAAALTQVDLYRPEYFIFENVFGISERDLVLEQMTSTLVGMGYQTSISLEDAWSHGLPQKRCRMFILATAPGLPPLKSPPKTHAHPPGTKNRSIGEGPNGEYQGLRSFEQTPFPSVTASEATADLPSIDDGSVNLCIPFPDHRLSCFHRKDYNLAIKHISRFPYGSNWIEAVKNGTMPIQIMKELRENPNGEWMSNSNKAMTRVDPNRQFSTIMTRCDPKDTRNGQYLHWDEHRQMSIMEARRAQGMPDHEVLVGNPADQWKILGNSVARHVAVALGFSLRKSWIEAHELGLLQQREEIVNDETVDQDVIEPAVNGYRSASKTEAREKEARKEEARIPTPTGSRLVPVIVIDD